MSGAKTKIPNAMTRQRWARRIAADLADTQEAKAVFEVTQFKHEHGDTDAVPGRQPKTEADGETFVIENGRYVFQTYGEIFAENEAAQARLWELAERENCTKLVKAIIEADGDEE